MTVDEIAAEYGRKYQDPRTAFYAYQSDMKGTNVSHAEFGAVLIILAKKCLGRA